MEGGLGADHARPRMTLTRIPGPAGRLHVDDGGADDPPTVFVHSFAGSSAHWSAPLAHLRPRRRAIALDLRGHGRSEAPLIEDYAIESLAKDIAAVVDRLGVERFSLVGHGLGAAAAIAYAGAHPRRVLRLLLVGAPGRVPADQAREILTALESDYDRVSRGYWEALLAGARPHVRAQVVSETGRLPRSAALSLIRSTFRFDPLPALGAYRGPRLAVVTPHGDAPHDLHHLVPGLPHRLVRGTSHWVHMDDPEAFNAILDEFLGAGGPPMP